MKKGFSLFTPLVGTALIIIAIIISVSMVQNDVRISRTLTKSYEISSMQTTVKLIKAGTELSVLKAMNEYSNFALNAITPSVVCNNNYLDAAACKTMNYELDLKNDLITNLKTQLTSQIFSSIGTSVETVGGVDLYEAGDFPATGKSQSDDMKLNVPTNAIVIDINTNPADGANFGTLKESINKAAFGDTSVTPNVAPGPRPTSPAASLTAGQWNAANLEKIYSVEATHPTTGNKVKVSVIPFNLQYTSLTEIGIPIKYGSDAYKALTLGAAETYVLKNYITNVRTNADTVNSCRFKIGVKDFLESTVMANILKNNLNTNPDFVNATITLSCKYDAGAKITNSSLKIYYAGTWLTWRSEKNPASPEGTATCTYIKGGNPSCPVSTTIPTITLTATPGLKKVDFLITSAGNIPVNVTITYANTTTTTTYPVTAYKDKHTITITPLVTGIPYTYTATMKDPLGNTAPLMTGTFTPT